TAEKGTYVATGYAPVHAAPSYLGNIPDAVVFDEKKGTRFTVRFKVTTTGGKIQASGKGLTVAQATDAVIWIAIATSFNGFDKDPATAGKDHGGISATRLQQAVTTGFESVRQSHLNDFKQFYDRFSLDLGPTTAPDLPTDARLKRYATGAEDKKLEELYFNFGRYLLISSSRTPGVPANLQGIWNPYMRPPWSSNYTININAEENYWPAETTNLSEMHRPLLSFIENLSKTGAVTARTFYGTGGWAAGHNSDIWAMSNPVGDFGKGDPVWANWNMGGTWLATHLWEHWTFTRDVDFLQRAWPLMKGSATFALEWMVTDRNGTLITSPSTSPENKFISPSGYTGATFYGATADLAMIREQLTQTRAAAEILGESTEFKARIDKALSLLRPYQIGADGKLLEWYHDWKDAEPLHRHQSHLFGLHPGHQITPEKTPALAAASRRTLEIKGDETTGWSKGWRINLWARLRDGDRAYKMYRELLRPVEPDGVKTNYARGGGTYPNLFDAHPPFQIDGNFGGTAAIAEMLVQSEEDRIDLLPALPTAWPEGSVRGLCARGGFVIDLTWKNNKPSEIRITSKTDGATILRHGGKEKSITLRKGESMNLTW
ncbi:MAG: glycosyl hydrolase family 95 catalytic domain-containing protein, partial [Bacteroidota bacterium]